MAHSIRGAWRAGFQAGAAVFAASLFFTTGAEAQKIAPAMACDALAGLDLSAPVGAPGKVETAVADKGVCHVKGTLRTTIAFEAWLPLESYTGRYLQMGCGGICGRISTEPPQAAGCAPFERGEFATAATDMGHRDPSANSWGADLERRADFGHRAQHLTTLAAKALITKFYGAAPRKSYFSGCSDGGREGLVAAQRYPEDFDGIVAGAPVLDWTAQNTFHHAWTVQKNRAADGSVPLTAVRLPVLNKLVLAACGSGANVVANPFACAFDPLKHICAAGVDPATCLTEGEAQAAAAIYGGPRTATGERITAGGLAYGSEANWTGTVAPDNATTPPRARIFSTGVLKNLAFAPGSDTPTPDALVYSAVTLERLAASQKVFDATSTNLAPFFARGGRLIVWHGLADQDIPPASTVAWWAALRRDLTAGNVDRSARLFMLPGLGHCRGGVANSSFDSLTPLLRWVEDGVAPEIFASNIAATRDIAAERFIGEGRFGRGQ